MNKIIVGLLSLLHLAADWIIVVSNSDCLTKVLPRSLSVYARSRQDIIV